jgi:hypothetical protein
VHTALCGVLHPEGEIVSTGPQDLARLERRIVLKLCAASLSAAALGTGRTRRRMILVRAPDILTCVNSPGNTAICLACRRSSPMPR